MTVATLAEIADQIRGVSYGKTDVVDRPAEGFLPVLRANNITDDGLSFDDLVYVRAEKVSAKQQVRLGDIVIAASSGSLSVVGKAAQAESDLGMGFGAFCKVVRPSTKVHARYIGHFFKTQDYRRRMSALAAGANINNLKNEHIDELEIPLPSLEEQKRIATILDQADELRRKRQRTIDRLNQLGQAIFHEMFFESSRDEWIKESLSDFCDIQVGFAFKSSDYIEDSHAVRLCRGANVLPSRIDWRDTARLPNAIAERHSEFALREKDIVIAMDRPWISEGFKTAMLGPLDLPSLLVQRVARLRAKSASDSDFLYFLVNSREFQASCHTTETTVPHISPKDIRGFKFLCPPEAERREFSKRSSHIRQMHEKAEESFAHSDRLFSSLQHRAFQGEL